MYLLSSGATIVCLEGEVNKYFEIAPPRLEELFHGPPGPVPVGSDVERWFLVALAQTKVNSDRHGR